MFPVDGADAYTSYWLGGSDFYGGKIIRDDLILFLRSRNLARGGSNVDKLGWDPPKGLPLQSELKLEALTRGTTFPE